MCIKLQKKLLQSHKLPRLSKKKLLPITTHVTPQDNNHARKMVDINILLDQNGSKQDNSKEASGNIQVQQSIATQPLGTIGTNIKLKEKRH